MADVSTNEVRVWDWPTRAFHWLLVASIACAWISFEYSSALGDDVLAWHRWNGIFVLVLLVFRLIWGLIGSSTARFAHFVPSPGTVIGYARAFAAGDKRAYLGHNPLGTLMVLTLLGVVMVQGVLGLFALEHNEVTAGPLKRLISDETATLLTKWHLRFFKLILVLAVVHVLANIAYGILAKDPLIPAMIKGTKPAKAYVDGAEARIPDNVGLRAFVAFALASVLVLGGITLAGGRLF